MPTPMPAEVIEAQRKDWNRVAGGWDKWDQYFSRNMTFINHRLAADARLRPGMQVLDVGSGTGYPALLAGEVVGSDGSVVGIDLAESMLAVATRKAQALGMKHVTFRTGDATALPFDGESFDAVISRFCSDVSAGDSESPQGHGTCAEAGRVYGSGRLVITGHKSVHANPDGRHQEHRDAADAGPGSARSVPAGKIRGIDRNVERSRASPG